MSELGVGDFHRRDGRSAGEAGPPLTVAIVGLGLIGGSMGMAWRDAPGIRKVIGVVRRPDAVDEAVALGACHEATTDLAAAAAAADVILVCTPVASVVATVKALLPSVRPGTIISDAGSTKGEICRALWPLLPPEVTFVGGHPMAGSERDGIRAADPYLFENAAYVLTPPGGADGALTTLFRLVGLLGAHPVVMDPDTHDTIVAAVSHVPHLTAAALVQTAAAVQKEIPETLTLAASGFRDTTRIAAGAPGLWREICLSNREAIVRVLEILRKHVDRAIRLIETGDGDGLEVFLREAREVRLQVPNRSKGILASLYEMVVEVVDRPGEIAAVTTLLAKAHVNVIDIEILRVREGEGGTLRLGFETEEARDQALRLMEEHGYRARPR